ncbi:hypothetical protein CRENBAI_002876 [Crenichthys baileyi]|uniref:Uncharacterized protein n=1 Tax=Crenichthys baileyi TaxID=28760 RepID=A0AAV9RBR4_9TELE
MERVERASAEWRDERENPAGVDGALTDVRRKKEVRQKDGKTVKEVNVFRILSDQTSRSDTHPLFIDQAEEVSGHGGNPCILLPGSSWRSPEGERGICSPYRELWVCSQWDVDGKPSRCPDQSNQLSRLFLMQNPQDPHLKGMEMFEAHHDPDDCDFLSFGP